MLLTQILFKIKLPKGHLYKGKHRLVKKVQFGRLIALHREFEIQEQNMLLLRHPYLTVEQSKGHNKDNKDKFNPAKVYQDINLKRYQEVTTIEKRLGHLQTSESWDV